MEQFFGAIGLIEIHGDANGVVAVDLMLKAADVQYIAKDTKCGGYSLIIIGGSVSAVQSAIDAVKDSSILHIEHAAVISNPADEVMEAVRSLQKK